MNVLFSQTHISLKALLETAESNIAEEENVRMAALFDNEEVGSESQQGAASSMTSDVLHRIAKAVAPAAAADSAQLAEIAFRKSFIVSADMAHAWHPNHTEKHEANHRPRMHAGPSLKHNANQRYATNAVTAFLMKELARRNSVPVQEFCVRNDSPCGSTIGPILSSGCGIRTVDLGIPQFAMHSIRETCGADDADHAVNLFKAFFSQFTKLDQELTVE
jgi:aspartyl aminopeptidase